VAVQDVQTFASSVKSMDITDFTNTYGFGITHYMSTLYLILLKQEIMSSLGLKVALILGRCFLRLLRVLDSNFWLTREIASACAAP
jgi:hypothetical protein